MPGGNELYDYIKSEGIIVNKDVWIPIYRRVNDSVSAIILACQYCLKNQEAMSAQEAKNMLAYVKDIKYTINPIAKTSKESLNFTQFEGGISLNPIMQQFIKHQFGYDVYAIELMLRDAIDPVSVLPIPLANIQKIIIHAEAIKESIERFKAALQQKEEKIYHNLYDSFKDGLVLTDMEGNVLDANMAYLDMLGYSEEEIKKLNSLQLTPEKWHKKEDEIVRSLINKKDNFAEYEKEYIKKDGSVFFVDLKIWLIEDTQKNPLGIWIIVRDITEYKKRQKEFEEDIFSSHAVIDNVSIGLSLSDKKGHFVIFNHRMQEITGYTMEEINQQDLGVLLYPDPKDCEKAIGRLSVITAESGALDVETKIKTKDGLERIVSVSTSLIN
ncbi:MAG: PAS domain S-box protein, partial [Candidatus Omnitrophota bacterium]